MRTFPQDSTEKARYGDWQYEVSNGDTVLGFRDWLMHNPAAAHPYAGAVTWHDNCTAGLMCPQCGATGTFRVLGAQVACTLSDDGVEQYWGCDFDDSTSIGCSRCDKTGVVSEFALPDGPEWDVDPATGAAVSTVPSVRHTDRAAITVEATGRWVVDPLGGSRGDYLCGKATGSEQGRTEALAAWRYATSYEPQ